MSFRLVPKSVTLNDLEWRNGRYFVLYKGLSDYRRSGLKNEKNQLKTYVESVRLVER